MCIHKVQQQSIAKYFVPVILRIYCYNSKHLGAMWRSFVLPFSAAVTYMRVPTWQFTCHVVEFQGNCFLLKITWKRVTFPAQNQPANPLYTVLPQRHGSTMEMTGHTHTTSGEKQHRPSTPKHGVVQHLLHPRSWMRRQEDKKINRGSFETGRYKGWNLGMHNNAFCWKITLWEFIKDKDKGIMHSNSANRCNSVQTWRFGQGYFLNTFLCSAQFALWYFVPK